MLAAGERACTAASAATLRSTLSGIPSVPELLVDSCGGLWDLRRSFRLSLLLSLSRSLPEEAAREPLRSVFWELMLRVRWLLLLLLLRLLLLRPPQSPSPSLLMLLQALWPSSFPLDDFFPSFSSALGRLYSSSSGGTS